MSRNNMERLGPVEGPSEDIPANLTKNEASGLSQPVEAVDLPTKGLFYSEGSPLYKRQFLELRYMTARDEEILNSKTLMQKGIAIDKLLQTLLVDPEVRVEQLFLTDKNALILAVRKMNMGSDYNTSITCLKCGSKSNHTFDLSKVVPKEIDFDKFDSNGMFEIELPKIKTKVMVRLLTGTDERSLKMSAEKKKKHNLPEHPMTDQLKQIIYSVNDDTDREVINKFVDNMLAMHARSLREQYNDLTPNMDLEQEFFCDSCSDSSDITIPFTSDFFWPKRTSG